MSVAAPAVLLACSPCIRIPAAVRHVPRHGRGSEESGGSGCTVEHRPWAAGGRGALDCGRPPAAVEAPPRRKEKDESKRVHQVWSRPSASVEKAHSML